MNRQWVGLALIASSADGYIARDDGDIAWLTDAPPEPRHIAGHEGPHPPPDYQTFYDSVDHLVMGRGTYEKVLSFDSWPYQGKRVIVLSTRLTSGNDPNVTVATDLDEVLTLLAERGAERIYVDGGATISTFLANDLLDELTVSVAPVLLGSGIRLFGQLPGDVRLILRGFATGDSGMVTSHYLIARPGQAPSPR